MSDPLPPATSTPPPLRSVRDTLFGDAPMSEWPPTGSTAAEVEPWKSFVIAREAMAAGNSAEAIAAWQRITESPGLESLHYLQAWHFLHQHGIQPDAARAKNLHGVVIEVAINGGLDLLAAYPEGTSRYYNYTGAGVVWERPDTSMDSLILRLLHAGQQVLNRIGPWTGDRPAAPPQGQMRLNFLAPAGLHFGQGQLAIMGKDPTAKSVIDAGTALMQELVRRNNQERESRA